MQNYVFKLINRATVDELTLSRDTVANIMNDSTKAYISTQYVKEEQAAPDHDPHDKPLKKPDLTPAAKLAPPK